MSGSRLRDSLRHPVAQNVLAVGTAQVAIIVVPLITLPYLARVLDRGEFGLVVFVQTFSFLVALLVEYGFNLSATRDVARRRDDPGALARTVAAVQGAKALLAAAAVVISLALWPVVPFFRDDPDLLAYGVVLGILQGYLPVWFFLGVERAQLTALAELTTRLAALVLIVLLVRDESDGELVLAVYTAAAAASVGFTTALMYRRVALLRPTRSASREALRRGRTLFAGTGATALYTGANAFLIGLILPAAQVAIFAAAEKVVRAANRVLGLMAQAVYPRASRLVGRGEAARATRLSHIALLMFGGAALAGGAVLAAFADPIVEVVFGSGFDDAVPLMRIMSLVVPLNVIGVVLATQRLLPRGLDRRVTAILVSASVLNAVLVALAAETSGLRTTAWAVVGVELFVVAASVAALRGGGRAEVVGEPDR